MDYTKDELKDLLYSKDVLKIEFDEILPYVPAVIRYLIYYKNGKIENADVEI